jgi:hypothetical protein
LNLLAKVYPCAVVSNGFPHAAVFKTKGSDAKTGGDKRRLFEIGSQE